MELRVLNYFLMVAREENITKAAQMLHVTQPTLSRQLMQLEEELGVTLFKRSNHRIVLTDDGMLLKRRAMELVSLADKTKQELTREREELTGTISIGAGELHSVSFLVEVMAAFQKECPKIHYELHSGNVDNIKDQMDRGPIDIGLLLEPADISKYEFIRMPVKESWGILTRSDSPLAGKNSVRPEDLIGVPLMTTKRELVQNELDNWFGEYRDDIEPVATYDLINNVAVMVQCGMGAALCLDLIQSYENLTFIPLSPPLELSSVLAWKKAQVSSRAVSAFIRFAKNYMLEMEQTKP